MAFVLRFLKANVMKKVVMGHKTSNIKKIKFNSLGTEVIQNYS